jgi:hypothetical protein
MRVAQEGHSFDPIFQNVWAEKEKELGREVDAAARAMIEQQQKTRDTIDSHLDLCAAQDIGTEAQQDITDLNAQVEKLQNIQRDLQQVSALQIQQLETERQANENLAEFLEQSQHLLRQVNTSSAAQAFLALGQVVCEAQLNHHPWNPNPPKNLPKPK